MSRLEGKKSNTSVWIITTIIILAVAAGLYFLFARPATQTPADSAPEPVPGMTEPAPQEAEPDPTPAPTGEVESNAPVTPAPGVGDEFATPLPDATPESLGPDNLTPSPPAGTIESL